MANKQGQASGLLVAIEWLHELEFKQVILTIDSQSVADSFNLSFNDRIKIGSILS